MSSFGASSHFHHTKLLPVISGVVKSCTAIITSCIRRITFRRSGGVLMRSCFQLYHWPGHQH